MRVARGCRGWRDVRVGLVVALVITLLLGGLRARPACADEGVASARVEATTQVGNDGGAIPVYDAQGLMAMADDPEATYRLMADIDLEGRTWYPITFRGTLEGEGHAILNAHVSRTGDDRHATYDGNMKCYDTAFAGFFGSLEGATVRDVLLLGVDVSVETSEPTFVGGLCGYMEGAHIEGCTVAGQVSLATSGASFGTGGIAGFGSGSIVSCVADVTLVCRDLDAVSKDEQFMGGLYANGAIDLDGNDVTIRGYDSDHGYVHDGGLAGMYIEYDATAGHVGSVTNNHVSGYITFFEDNLDRRAYCDPVIGECMSFDVVREGNTNEFTRDERFEYDTDLLPHACESPQWVDDLVQGSCTRRGYTLHTCETCGYSYQANWTPVAHEVGDWTVLESATDGAQVLEGACSRCGTTVFHLASAREVAELQEAGGTGAVASGEGASLGLGDVLGMLVRVLLGAVLLAVVAGVAALLWLRFRQPPKRPQRRPVSSPRGTARQANQGRTGQSSRRSSRRGPH